jgi:monovalent cation/hydrogen antiporter
VPQFVLVSGGGVIIGLLVGVVTRRALCLTGESLPQIAITLLAPYVAWIIAERAHTSAVLACVAGGLYLRQGFSVAVPPITRLQARAVWDLLIFILNGVIFILIGLELGQIREAGWPENLGIVVGRAA